MFNAAASMQVGEITLENNLLRIRLETCMYFQPVMWPLLTDKKWPFHAVQPNIHPKETLVLFDWETCLRLFMVTWDNSKKKTT